MNNQVLKVNSPYDNSPIGEVCINSEQEALEMLDRAVEIYKNRAGWLSFSKRKEILINLAKLVEAEQEEFAILIAKEGGKPLSDAKAEVIRAIDGIRLAEEAIDGIEKGEEVPMGRTKPSQGREAHISYEPRGVVIALSAFNHPLNLIVHQAIPAIAVGCPVIVKPSSKTPLNCKRLIELIHQAGLPDGWCQLCICDNQTATMLATSKKVGFLSFIGSEKVGWDLKGKLAKGVHCALEHGGVAPAIVDKSANLTEMIPALVKGGFYHAGQVCVSVQKIFVHSEIVDEFTQRFAKAADELKVGDPTFANTDVGPLIDPKEVRRVDEWVSEAVEQGGELVTGGEKLSETTYAPTVLLNPSSKSKVSTEEIFGPVVCIYSYDNLDEAVNQANSLDYAFQASVCSEDAEVSKYCIDRLDATAVMVNDHTAFRVDWMPFGGRKHSGYGLGGIGYTMHDMVQIKMAVRKAS